MPRFPVDAPKNRVVRALEQLGYRPIRERNHICMARENPDGSRSVLVLPNHPTDIQSLAFSPDGSVLASASYDGTILLWDMKSYLC